MRPVVCLAVAVVAAAVIASCCGAPPIGQEFCSNPSRAVDGGTFVYSPAVECTSRICLIEYLGGQSPASICTRECSSKADCLTSTRILCAEGYGCENVAGYPHPVCVCSTLLDGGLP